MMSDKIKELLLEETYSFQIIVEINDCCYAGKLDATPEKITLKITGELRCEDDDFNPRQVAQNLVCNSHSSNGTFLLFGAKFSNGGWRTIQRHPITKSYFEYIFDVSHIIFLPSSGSLRTEFFNIQIHSKTIANWVGITENSQKLINKATQGFNLHEDFTDISTEFHQYVGDDVILTVGYNYQAGYSLSEMKSGVTYDLVLNLLFQNDKSANACFECFAKLYSLFAFITGGELDIQKICFTYDGAISSNKASLYCTELIKRNNHTLILFPYGANLAFRQNELPEFPIKAFENYFQLTNDEQAVFEKYIKYRRLENVEEQFLGYFRLLEKLCYKESSYLDEDKLIELGKKSKKFLIKYFNDKKNVESFLKSLPRFNNQKFNTEKCIQDFIKLIPDTFSASWRYKKQDISIITRLRNDIIHANAYNESKDELHSKTKLIEALLTVQLFLKLGVNLDSILLVLGRLNGYNRIVLNAD